MNPWLILAIAELSLIAVAGQIFALFCWNLFRERPSSQTECVCGAAITKPSLLATPHQPFNAVSSMDQGGGKWRHSARAA
jgi:hypothetical protein